MTKQELKWTESAFTYGQGAFKGNTFVWSDVYILIGEAIAQAHHGAAELAQWQKEQPEKKKKLIQLLCRVNGEKFEEEKYIHDEKIVLTVKDIEMLASKVLSEAISVIIVEKKDKLSNRAHAVSSKVNKSIQVLTEQLEGIKERISELSAEPNEKKIESLDVIHKEIHFIEEKMENLIKSMDGE